MGKQTHKKEPGNIPIGSRNFSGKVMNKVIYVEMGQRLLPTCKSESASHSVGCAITKMALD
jgi:hypothetical protein